MNPTTSTKTV